MNDYLDKERWLDEALAQIPEDLTADETGTTHRKIVDSYLRPLLKRCHSKTRPRFWQWLRLQLAKTEGMATYLSWLRESRCPAELPVKSSVEYQMSADSRVALINVGNAQRPAVWKVPVSRLQWALELCPVTLKALPRLEGQELKEIRRLKLQLKTSPFLTTDQRRKFVADISDLERQSKGEYAPVERYCLVKSVDGRERAVHRIFLDVDDLCEVAALDGDFLNFDTMKVRITVEPVPTHGVAVGKYGRRPETETQEFEIPNLQPVYVDAYSQAMLSYKQTLQRDVSEKSLRVLPNADLGKRTQYFGEIVDCGEFDPLTHEEWVESGEQVETDVKISKK